MLGGQIASGFRVAENFIIDTGIETVVPIIRLRNRLRISPQSVALLSNPLRMSPQLSR
jgi:hypothetical protein